MPKGGKKKSTTVSPELKYLKALRDDLDHIRDDLDKALHKPLWKQSLVALLIGLIRGIGFVLGTTVLAASVIYLFQELFGWSHVTDSVSQWIGQIIQQF